MPDQPDAAEGDETAELPLLSRTSWAELAAQNLPIFLSDHAVCEQQAALSALALEEVTHRPASLLLRPRSTGIM